MSELLYNLDYYRDVACGDLSFVNKMIELFISHVPGLVNEMEAAYQKKDLAEVGRIAHKIKPNLDNMGIHSVTKTIRTIEQLGKSETNIPELPGLILEVKDIISKTVMELQNAFPIT